MPFLLPCYIDAIELRSRHDLKDGFLTLNFHEFVIHEIYYESCEYSVGKARQCL